MTKTTDWGWGSRNAALAVMGLNVVLAAVLALVSGAIDLVPYDVGMVLYRLTVQLHGASGFAMLLGALTFLPWLHVTYARAAEVAATPELEQQKMRGPVISFFIPFANLVRPYGAVRALDEALDPSRVPLPKLRTFEPGVGYREAAPLVLPDLRCVPSAPVGVWWALWITRLLVNTATAVSHTTSNAAVVLDKSVTCAAGVAACIVIWRIAARLEEVERRHAMLEAETNGSI